MYKYHHLHTAPKYHLLQLPNGRLEQHQCCMNPGIQCIGDVDISSTSKLLVSQVVPNRDRGLAFCRRHSTEPLPKMAMFVIHIIYTRIWCCNFLARM